MPHIDRCICYQELFSDLKRVADATGAGSVEALQQHVAFGLNCGMCRPYVRRMLDTGETVFHEIIREPDSASCSR